MDPCVLWARAIAAGSIAFFLGVAGHVMAAGLLPGVPFLSALFAMSVLLSAPILSRPAGRLRLMALMVGGQTVIHLVLSVTAGHAGDPTATTPAVVGSTGLRSLPVVDGHRVGSLQDAYQGMSGQPSSLAPTLPIGHLINDLTAHASMMAAHLAAAALVGLWLAYGERCLWTILALTGQRIVAVWLLLHAPVTATPSPRSTYILDRAPAGPRSHWLVRPDSRRGPPLLTA